MVNEKPSFDWEIHPLKENGPGNAYVSVSPTFGQVSLEDDSAHLQGMQVDDR